MGFSDIKTKLSCSLDSALGDDFLLKTKNSLVRESSQYLTKK